MIFNSFSLATEKVNSFAYTLQDTPELHELLPLNLFAFNKIE